MQDLHGWAHCGMLKCRSTSAMQLRKQGSKPTETHMRRWDRALLCVTSVQRDCWSKKKKRAKRCVVGGASVCSSSNRHPPNKNSGSQVATGGIGPRFTSDVGELKDAGSIDHLT